MGEGGPFILMLFSDSSQQRFFFFAVVLTVVISIVLHELAHGWMALRLGDTTPRAMGRMTGNPLVHMGPFSLVALALVGFAWGQMPIDPTRLRGKYGAAKVALAGPLMNLAIALVCAAAAGAMLSAGFNQPDQAHWKANLLMFASVAARVNLILMFFNLLPAPPLDGSHIAANLSPGYARFFDNPSNQGAGLLLFFGAFMVTTSILALQASRLAGWAINGVATLLG
ncbi:MAG: site-2 protease family protein [Planctomycetota bacterium]